MRKFFLVALTLVTALSLAACNSKKEATAYGLVHKHYVGEVKVEVASNGTVKAVAFEEYFLPTSWAKVTVTDPQNAPADTVKIVGARGTDFYAKFIKIGDKLFTASLDANGAINYSARDIVSIEQWVKDHDNAKWYVEQVKAGKFFISTVDGTKNAALVRSDTTSNKSMQKSLSGYWAQGEAFPLGWQGNIAAMTEAFVGTKMVATKDQLVKDGTWKFGDVTTTATLTDFADYYLLAQAAFNAAK